MAELDIGEVSRQAGVPPSALRYYEQQGLIRPIGRNGLRRVYAGDVVERLALIALGQSAGFSLAEVAQMLGADGRPRIDRAKLAAKAGDLDGTIRRLIALRNGLRHAAACPARHHLECPTFRRLMKGAIAPRGTPRARPAPPRNTGSPSRARSG